MELNNSNKTELIGVNSQSDLEETLNKLENALKKQGFNVTDDQNNQEEPQQEK